MIFLNFRVFFLNTSVEGGCLLASLRVFLLALLMGYKLICQFLRLLIVITKNIIVLAIVPLLNLMFKHVCILVSLFHQVCLVIFKISIGDRWDYVKHFIAIFVSEIGIGAGRQFGTLFGVKICFLDLSDRFLNKLRVTITNLHLRNHNLLFVLLNYLLFYFSKL